MPPRAWRERIEDILAAVYRILEYTAELDEREFTSDPRTIDAVVRNLEVIGEAARHVPDRVRERYPDVPWIDMRDMRNLSAYPRESLSAYPRESLREKSASRMQAAR